MEINIPGRDNLTIHHLVLDYNGTIACDGQLIPLVKEKIEFIHQKGIKVHLLTADTHGSVKKQCNHMPVDIHIFDHSNAAENKREVVEKLGKENCVCIGNGLNDGQMFEACSLAIIVIGEEGCSAKSLVKADIVCKNIEDALDLLVKPSRIIATLRG